MADNVSFTKIGTHKTSKHATVWNWGNTSQMTFRTMWESLLKPHL